MLTKEEMEGSHAEQPQLPFQGRKLTILGEKTESPHQLESPRQVEVLCKLEGSWVIFYRVFIAIIKTQRARIVF